MSTALKVQLQVEGCSPGWKLANDAAQLSQLDEFDQAFYASAAADASLSTITFARSGSILLLSTLLVLISLPVMALFVALFIYIRAWMLTEPRG